MTTAPQEPLRALFGDQPLVLRDAWFDDAGLGGALAALHPDEAHAVADAVPARRREYAAGRACARAALRHLGIAGFPLLNGDDRAPRWPPGVVGTITHTRDQSTRGYCGVAVGWSKEIAGVGLDAEPTLPLPRDAWDLVLTGGERKRLGDPEAPAFGLQARLIFSAKECVYKGLFGAGDTRWLDFHDVEVALDEARGAYRATVAKVPWRGEIEGRFVSTPTLLFTGAVIPRGGRTPHA